MPRCFVFMHDALGDHFVDQRHRIRQRGASGIGILGLNGSVDGVLAVLLLATDRALDELRDATEALRDDLSALGIEASIRVDDLIEVTDD